jgi:tetratricopeptide (TPR) repeat protein
VTAEVKSVYTGGSEGTKQPATGHGTDNSQQDVRQNALLSPLYKLAAYEPRRQTENYPPVILMWRVSGASVCKITPGIGIVSAVGKATAYPDASTTYTLEVTGDGQSLSAQVPVIVTRPTPTAAASEQANTSLVRAHGLFAREFYDKAIAAYQAILAADGGNRQAQTGLAEARAAKEAETRLSGRGGESGEDFVRKAQQLYDNGEYEAAIAAFAQVLAANPGNSRARRKGLTAAKAAAEAEKRVQ